MGRLVLGLDIGITSVGYGVIDIDNNQFVDYGGRLFKEGTAASNEERRTKRGARRLKRRKANRKGIRKWKTARKRRNCRFRWIKASIF